MAPSLEIRLLGSLEVVRDGVLLTLPPSKKTRALLGYLVATGRGHSRERLTDLLWEIPDDRRGALRWSLSQLRKLVDDEGTVRIVTTGGEVTFAPRGCAIDIARVAEVRATGLDQLERLEQAASLFRGPFMEGLEQPESFEFQSWLLAQRETWRDAHGRVLQALVQSLESQPEQALGHARAWVAVAPADAAAWSAVVRTLSRLGRTAEAEEHYRFGKEKLDGPMARQLEAAWRSIVAPTPTAGSPAARAPAKQQIRFCTCSDGVRIAYASVGSGPPLVKTANWMSHLEYDWKSPFWRHLASELSTDYTLVRYDQRGNGLSDWSIEDFSFERFVADFETVVDACGLERFPVLGISQGCAVAIEYAVRHPERVSRLILLGGFAKGWKHRSQSEQLQRHAMLTLMREGWGSDNPAFRQLFSTLFMPDADAETLRAFNELQLVSCSPENAARISEANAALDVSERLPLVSAPTLVLHANRDARAPFEQGKAIAAGIPGARFVALESRNHLILGGEPAWRDLLDQLGSFLAEPD